MCAGLHVKYSFTRYPCQTVTQLELPRHILEKHSSAKFHKNPPSGGPVAPSGRTDRHNSWQMTNVKQNSLLCIYFYF